MSPPSEGPTVRPTATGLATAFFRLYLLESLAAGQARPAALLAAIAAERLPFAAGAFDASGLRLLRLGQRVRIETDDAGRVLRLTIPTLPFPK